MAIFADKRDGKVTGRWRVELQLDGQRLRKRFDSLEEAKEYEAKARAEIAHGRMPQEAKQRLEKKATVQTLEQLCRAVEGHLWAGSSSERQAHQRLEGACRILGSLRTIESITISDTDRLVKVLRDRGNAHGTINRYLSALNQALKWAIKHKCRVSPIPELEWQDEDEGRIRWITPEEEATLMGLLGPQEALAAFVAMRTGMRRGELLGLRQRDVEVGWVHLWGTRTKSGKSRSIPLSGDAYAALQELFRLGMPTPESLRYQWNTAKAQMGLEDDEDFVYHATRHTFATRAVQAGVHPRVLQRLMGHKHLSTTMRYMQVSDHMLTAAIELMSDPIGSIANTLTMGSHVGVYKGGGTRLNPPDNLVLEGAKTLRKQELRTDLGSCGETRGGSSPSARTKQKSV